MFSSRSLFSRSLDLAFPVRPRTGLRSLLGRFHYAGKIRHCLAQHAVDRGALASVKIALEFSEPALDHFDRRANWRGGDHAVDSDFGSRLLVREQNFVQPFARPNASENDIDIPARLEAAKTNHPFC